MVEQRGVEPLTSALRTLRSAKLSYCPTLKLNDKNLPAKCQVLLHDGGGEQRIFRVGGKCETVFDFADDAVKNHFIF